MPIGTGDVELCAQRRRKRLLDQVHTARASLHRRLNDSALLDLGHAARNADNDAGLDEGKADDLFQELLEHFFRHLIVGDHTVAQRAHRNDVARRPPEHIAGSRADLKHLACIFIHGHDRRLAEHNAAALLIDQNVRRSKVDADVSGQFHMGITFRYVSLGVASAAQTTSAAPALRRTRAHSDMVAPVVTISSISRTRFPAKRSGCTAR